MAEETSDPPFEIHRLDEKGDLFNKIKELEIGIKSEITAKGGSTEAFKMTSIQFEHNPRCWIIQKPDGSWYWFCPG